jgi:GGDEF domain-containing protein
VLHLNDVKKAAAERAAHPSSTPAGSSFESDRKREKAALTMQLDSLDSSQIRKIAAVSDTGGASRKLRVASYCRVSTDDIDQAISIHLQQAEYKKKIKSNPEWSNIPVIFLTSDESPETEAECLRLGAEDYIRKPFVSKVMKSRIERVISMHSTAKNMIDQASRDALTGLYNRKNTEEMIEKVIEENTPGMMFMIDLDNFNTINDNMGHAEGDRVIRRLFRPHPFHNGVPEAVILEQRYKGFIPAFADVHIRLSVFQILFRRLPAQEDAGRGRTAYVRRLCADGGRLRPQILLRGGEGAFPEGAGSPRRGVSLRCPQGL